MKNTMDIRTVIYIATLVFAMGGAWAITSTKAKDVDVVKAKTEDLDKRVLKNEVIVDNIQEDISEQKALTKEVQGDVKQILNILMRDR